MEQPTITIPESEYRTLREAAETLETYRANSRARRRNYLQTPQGRAAAAEYEARRKAKRAAERAAKAQEAGK